MGKSMPILLWPGYDTLARGPVSKGHYCSDKECGLYPMGKSRVRWFTRECYLGAGVKAQEESHWEAGVIELAINKQLVCLIPGDLKRSLMKCLSAQLTGGGWREKLLSVSHLPLIGGSSAFSDWAYLTARWVPMGTSRSSVGQRGLERPSGCPYMKLVRFFTGLAAIAMAGVWGESERIWRRAWT